MRMRMRVAAFVLVLLAALAPLAGLASSRANGPVMSGAFDAADADAYVDGSGCAGLNYFYLYSQTAAVTADARVFGFAAASPTVFGVRGEYVRTVAGQRVFYVSLDTYSDADIYESEFYWAGYAALTCLADGSLRFDFKPSADYYYDQYNPDTGYDVEGNLGRTARVSFTLDLAADPAQSSASFTVYGPVTLNQTAVHTS